MVIARQNNLSCLFDVVVFLLLLKMKRSSNVLNLTFFISLLK